MYPHIKYAVFGYTIPIKKRARSLAWLERSADNREVWSSNLRGPINETFLRRKFYQRNKSLKIKAGKKNGN